MDQRSLDHDQVFLIANDVGWSRTELADLRSGLEIVAPIDEHRVRTVDHRDRATSTLLVGLGHHLETFLDFVASDDGTPFLDPLIRSLRRHSYLPGLERQRLTLTGVHRDVEIAVVTDSHDVDEIVTGIERWRRVLDLVNGNLDRHEPDEVRWLEIAWTPSVDSWVVQETMLENGEVLPGPIFEETA